MTPAPPAPAPPAPPAPAPAHEPQPEPFRTKGRPAITEPTWSRQQLHDAVATHPPANESERQTQERFLAELARLEHPCDQQADPVHVTASAVVAGQRGTVLLLHRRLRRWLQPGGHIEAAESPPDAALREAHEETGLDVWHPAGGPRLLCADVHQAAQGHTHLDLRYLLFAADRDPAPPPDESPDVRWYTWDEAATVADQSLRDALVSARREWEHHGGSASAPGGLNDG